MGDFLGLALLPLLGGFIFLETYKATTLRLKPLSERELVFYSAAVGFAGDILTMLFVRIVGFAIRWLSSFLKNIDLEVFYPRHIHLETLASILDHSIAYKQYIDDLIAPYQFHQVLAFLILIMLPKLLNKRIDRNKEFDIIQDATIRDGSLADTFLLEAQAKERPVLVTLKNDKVYSGYIIEVDNPALQRRVGRAFIKILPSMSGYRDKEIRKVNFITPYEPVWKDELLLKELDLDVEDFVMFLPKDEIVSVRGFEQDAYRASKFKRVFEG